MTRRRLAPWDRLKFLIALVIVWFLVVWYQMSADPTLGFIDASRQQLQVRSGIGRWLILLFAVELLRQLSYLLAERSRRYYRVSSAFFGTGDRVASRASDYTRFRVARAVKWLIVIAILAAILGLAFGTSPVQGLFAAPAKIFHVLPTILYFMVILLLGVSQFAAIFWFMSRGGVDVYYPGDVTTRFADVWGQDHVVGKVQENILFLEDPESIEDHGGYVPGGILLWGPPGTGKTLMAEAVAGETGKPYVFVDPGAFINMFFGVGILKVKGLFRRLRKLAVRYGGVIVFFDEADSLGNRGGSVGGQGAGQGSTPGRASGLLDPCRGFSYLSESTQSGLYASALQADPAPPRAGRFRQMIPTGMGGGGGMGTLQALLTELSGLKKPRGFFNRIVRRTLGMKPKPPPKYRILVIMATNMPSALDEALLRPGRIDRLYRVGYPSKEGRKRTYQGYFAKVQHDITPDEIDHLATITPYATGATIKDLVNESLIATLRDGRTAITWADVTRAKLAKSVGPSEGVEYIERERHAVRFARGVPRGDEPSGPEAERHRHRHDPEGRGLPGLRQADPDRGAVHLVAQRVRGRHHGQPRLAGGASGCSSAVTTAPASPATCRTRPRCRWPWRACGAWAASTARTPPPGRRRDAHPVADGNDRNVLETAFGQRAEEQLGARGPHRSAARRAPGQRAGGRPRARGAQDDQRPGRRRDHQRRGRPGRGRAPVPSARLRRQIEAYHELPLSAHTGDRRLPLPGPLPAKSPELSRLPATPTDNRADPGRPGRLLRRARRRAQQRAARGSTLQPSCCTERLMRMLAELRAEDVMQGR